MPQYLFENPSTGEIVEIYQSMNDKHEYEENGIKFNRIFTSPCANIDAIIDPFSRKEFIDKTFNKKGTYGSALDLSAELSQKRAEKNGGLDPVREKFFDNYEKTHAGLKHPEKRKRETNAKLKSLGIEIK